MSVSKFSMLAVSTMARYRVGVMCFPIASNVNMDRALQNAVYWVPLVVRITKSHLGLHRGRILERYPCMISKAGCENLSVSNANLSAVLNCDWSTNPPFLVAASIICIVRY